MVVILIGVILALIVKCRLEYYNSQLIHKLTVLQGSQAGLLQRIPRKIYRTWKSHELGVFKDAWDFTQNHNPDYEQILLTDQDASQFMCTFMDGYAAHAYHALVPGAAKADLLRYCLIYEYGGIYLDIKTGAKELYNLIHPQDTMVISGWSSLFTWSQTILRKLKIICKHTPVNGQNTIPEIQNWWIAAVPNHPLLLKVIQEVVFSIEQRLHNNQLHIVEPNKFKGCDVHMTTGPFIYTRTIYDYIQQNGLHDIRVTAYNGNSALVYDVAGNHSKVTGVYKKGSMFDKDANMPCKEHMQ